MTNHMEEYVKKIREDFKKHPEKYPKVDEKFWNDDHMEEVREKVLKIIREAMLCGVDAGVQPDQVAWQSNERSLTEEALKLISRTRTAALQEGKREALEEIKSVVLENHKEIYDKLKDKIHYDSYSDDYKHGILRGYTLIGRYLTALTQTDTKEENV